MADNCPVGKRVPSGDTGTTEDAMLNRLSYGDDILADAKSAAIKALYIKWKTLSQLKRVTLTDFLDGRGRTPDRYLALLSVGDDYMYVYHGIDYREAVGFDLSGRMMSEIDKRVVREMKAVYDQVRETRIPVRVVYVSDTETAALGMERLILPLRCPDDTRMLLTYSDTLNSAVDIHHYLFETSPHMLIVAMPITDYDGRVVDADIIAANPTAQRFFATERFTEKPIQLRQLSPWFGDDDTWRLLTRTAVAEQHACTLTMPDTGAALHCIVVRLEYLMLVRIFPLQTTDVVTID